MTDSLLEVYIERLLAEREKRWAEQDRRYKSEREADQHRVNYALTAAEKASDRAVAVSNEFRGQLADQAATFLRKEEAQARLNAIEARIDVLSKSMDHASGRAGGIHLVWIVAVQIATIVVAVVAVYVRH